MANCFKLISRPRRQEASKTVQETLRIIARQVGQPGGAYKMSTALNCLFLIG